MHYIITFKSSKFHISHERKNPINPIYGVSLGEWLSLLLKQKNINVTDIDAEDWGWYVYVTLNYKKYLVGFIAIPDEEESDNAELIIQVNKKRSFIELLTFKEKMNETDELLQLIHQFVSKIEDAKNIEVEKVA